MISSLAVTVIGPDRPGLINLISTTAAAHDANWMESHLADLAGQFAGIVRLEVSTTQLESLSAALKALETTGLQVTIAVAAGGASGTTGRVVLLELLGQDHPGIVRDISQVLADCSVSIMELETETFSGSMSGENMFKAQARLRVPLALSTATLDENLQSISAGLMVDLVLEEKK